MSLETWKAEFYPVTVADCPEGSELFQDLRKWRGLRKPALTKHNVALALGAVVDVITGERFVISGNVCASCFRWRESGCSSCPLDSCLDAWAEWVAEADPEPMIKHILNAMPQVAVTHHTAPLATDEWAIIGKFWAGIKGAVKTLDARITVVKDDIVIVRVSMMGTEASTASSIAAITEAKDPEGMGADIGSKMHHEVLTALWEAGYIGRPFTPHFESGEWGKGD